MEGRVSTYESDVSGDGFTHLGIHCGHALRAGSLDGPHRDPFDRMQAAQALIEDLIIVTRDPAFASFGCRVLWQ